MSHPELIDAIGAGRNQEALELLERDADLCTVQDTPSALMLALYRAQFHVAEAIADRRQALTLFEAAAMGNVAQLAGDVTALSEDGFTPLHLACFFGREQAVRHLLAAGADPDAVARNPMRVRPLHSAAANRSVAICRLLLDAGADPDAQQERGFTALHAAAMHGLEPMVELLLAHGASPAIAADDGKTAAAFATEGGYPDLARRLAPQPA